MNAYGAQSMVDPLLRVLVHPPDEAVLGAVPTDWHYSSPVDLAKARKEHADFVDLLRGSSIEVIFVTEALDNRPDGVFMHDPSLVTKAGALIGRMGKALRRGEEQMHERAYGELGIPVLGRIEAPGTLESGDCVWIDANTLLVGCGFRTNRDGIAQLTRMLTPHGVTVHAYDLPVGDGSKSCLHLMSVLSMLDRDLALAFPPLMPVRLVENLRTFGVRLLETPPEEFRRSRKISANVLAIGPKSCVMLDGYPETAELLREAGCRVDTFAGKELCEKMEGGPTCLTRPVLRA